MKHLRKYNENKSPLDNDFIDECFIDFIDDGAEVEYGDADDGDYIYNISIMLPNAKYINGIFSFKIGNTIKDRVNYAKELLDFYENIDYCLNRVISRFPNIRHELQFHNEYVRTEDIGGYVEGAIEAYVHITFSPGKNIIVKPESAGKLSTIKFSELDNTWDVRSKNEN